MGWIFVGLWKFSDLDAFESVLAQHALVPAAARSHSWLVPASEAAIGIALAICAGRRSFGASLAATGSIALLLAFAVYVCLVPDLVLRRVGCGCGFQPMLIAAGIEQSGRLVHLAITGLLIVAHAPLWLWRPAHIEGDSRR